MAPFLGPRDEIIGSFSDQSSSETGNLCGWEKQTKAIFCVDHIELIGHQSRYFEQNQQTYFWEKGVFFSPQLKETRKRQNQIEYKSEMLANIVRMEWSYDKWA